MDAATTSALAAVTLAPSAVLVGSSGRGHESGQPPATTETLAGMQALLEAQTNELVEARAARLHAENVLQAEKDARVDAQRATEAAENAAKTAENAAKAAEKATESERDARISAVKAMEAEREARLAAESRVRSGPTSPVASGSPSGAHGEDVIRVHGLGSVRITPESLATPSRAAQAQSILAPKRGILLAHPVSVPRPSTTVGDAFRQLLDIVVADEQPPARALLSESHFYEVATSILPPFVSRVGIGAGTMDGTALFSVAGTCTRAWSFSEQCQPELNVRGNNGHGTYVPGFNGELKSARDLHALEQAVYYAMMDLTRIFFPASASGVACSRRFFNKPPVAYALIAFPHVGYVIAIEMIGKLLVAPVTAPFFLGSQEHVDAMQSLHAPTYAEPWLPPPQWDKHTWSVYPPKGDAKVAWTTDTGQFLKLVQATARTGNEFVSMYHAYTRLATLLKESPPPGRPAALPAYVELMFGAHEVIVRMPAVHSGRECTDDQILTAGPILDAVAAAVVWLAVRGVIYVDVRGPNVLATTTPSVMVSLVDFDDCQVVDHSVCSIEDYEACLSKYSDHVQTAYSDIMVPSYFAARYLRGQCQDFADAMRVAFQREAL